MDATPSATQENLQHRLMHMLVGYEVSQALHVAAKIGLVDVLHRGPTTSEEIAQEVGADEPSLRRFLRFLASADVLIEDDNGAFTATPMGDMLGSNHPQSIHRWAALLGSPTIWGPWGALYETVMTGQPAFDLVYGEPYFAYLEHHPDDASLFNAAMSDDGTAAVLDAYDFSGYSRIVDVAGGHGAFLQAILERYPQLQGVLCDLPFVVDQADELKDSAVSGRCTVVAGDMFHSVPAGGDAYVLKRILHDWSDEACIRILRNCRDAMDRGGSVLVVEQIVQPGAKSPASDIMMLVLVTGHERTEDEFRALFAAAGLHLINVTPASGYFVMEAGVSE